MSDTHTLATESRRDQVKAMIATGQYTKKEIAAALGVKEGSVSSQMTYLRWMGNYITSDPETKKLKFVSEDEHQTIQATAQTARAARSTASGKSPQERANALVGTITKQKEALAKAQARVTQIESDIVATPDDLDLADMLELAKANVVIMKNKLKQNEALAKTLPEPQAQVPAAADGLEAELTGSDDEVDDGVDDEVDDEVDENTENDDLV